MLCSKCGTEIPNEARFCWKCGQPQHVGAEPSPSEDDYEVCEVRFFDRMYGIVFEARLGRTLIASSSPTITSRRQANQDVVSKLIAQGWEPAAYDKMGLVTAMRRRKQAVA